MSACVDLVDKKILRDWYFAFKTFGFSQYRNYVSEIDQTGVIIDAKRHLFELTDKLPSTVKSDRDLVSEDFFKQYGIWVYNGFVYTGPDAISRKKSYGLGEILFSMTVPEGPINEVLVVDTAVGVPIFPNFVNPHSNPLTVLSDNLVIFRDFYKEKGFEDDFLGLGISDSLEEYYKYVMLEAYEATRDHIASKDRMFELHVID
ncbi:MAG: hypothetical protein ACMXYK_05915 [Candidatus Woesearchaeota archaeon]